MDTTKRCTKCGEVKPLDCFGPSLLRCRQCINTAQNARYKLKRDWIKAGRPLLPAPPKATTKTCPKCGESKLFEFFNRISRGPTGISSHCKICHATYRRKRTLDQLARQRENRARNRAHYREVNRLRYRRNAKKILLRATSDKEKARRRLLVSELRPAYVKAVLRKSTLGIPASEIPPEFVEMKRVMLAQKRTFRAINHHVKKESKP